MPLAHLMGCILNPVSFRSEVYVTAWSACACPRWEVSAEAQPLGDIRKSMWQSTKFSHFSEILCLCNCVQREKKAALWRLKQFSGVMIWRISCSVSWGCRKPARSLWMESMRCLITLQGNLGIQTGCDIRVGQIQWEGVWSCRMASVHMLQLLHWGKSLQPPPCLHPLAPSFAAVWRLQPPSNHLHSPPDTRSLNL